MLVVVRKLYQTNVLVCNFWPPQFNYVMLNDTCTMYPMKCALNFVLLCLSCTITLWWIDFTYILTNITCKVTLEDIDKLWFSPNHNEVHVRFLGCFIPTSCIIIAWDSWVSPAQPHANYMVKWYKPRSCGLKMQCQFSGHITRSKFALDIPPPHQDLMSSDHLASSWYYYISFCHAIEVILGRCSCSDEIYVVRVKFQHNIANFLQSILNRHPPWLMCGNVVPGPCLTSATWRCRKNFSQWECSFHWKLRCHWLEFLQQRQIAVVRQGPGDCS